MRIRTSLTWVLILAALAMPFEIRISAASRLTEDLPELLKAAVAVAEIQVEKYQDVRGVAGDIPMSVVVAQVRRLLKGDLPQTIEIERFGGMQGSDTLVFPGQAKLTPGDYAIVLLVQSPQNNGRWRVIGGDVGCVLRETTLDGEQLFRRAAGLFSFYVADENSVTGLVAHNSTVLSAENVSALVNTILATGRPILDTLISASLVEPEHISTQTAAMQSTDILPIISVDLGMARTNVETPFIVKLVLVLILTTSAYIAVIIRRKLVRENKNKQSKQLNANKYPSTKPQCILLQRRAIPVVVKPCAIPHLKPFKAAVGSESWFNGKQPERSSKFLGS